MQEGKVTMKVPLAAVSLPPQLHELLQLPGWPGLPPAPPLAARVLRCAAPVPPHAAPDAALAPQPAETRPNNRS